MGRIPPRGGHLGNLGYHDLGIPAQAQRRLQKWIRHWKDTEPDALRNFTYYFQLTLTYLTAPVEWQSRLKTSNPIERLIKELNRKLKQVSIFPSAASWERCAWLVWKLLEATG